MAWLEGLAKDVCNHDSDLNTQNSIEISRVSTSINSNDLKIVQAKFKQMQQDYCQLRYGRLSTLETNDSEYQAVLKQVKKDAHELF